MDGHQYEYQCAKILKNKGFSKVQVTKGSGDQGIDVIAYSGGKKYGIQCKYYTSPVGNHAVQEAFSGAKYYDCDVAVVMTNTTFTPAAKELAKKTGVLLWGDNRIPFSSNNFNLTKYLGIISLVIGILGVILVCNTKDASYPIFQIAKFVMLAIGGFFGIFELRQWGMTFISGVFYFVSVVMNVMCCFLYRHTIGIDMLFFVVPMFISFFRADCLHKKTNGYHIWKNGFKQFVHDNFSKDNSNSDGGW